MPRLPWTAGVMASSHLVLLLLIGEAVWITAVTPALLSVEIKSQLIDSWLLREQLITSH